MCLFFYTCSHHVIELLYAGMVAIFVLVFGCVGLSLLIGRTRK